MGRFKILSPYNQNKSLNKINPRRGSIIQPGATPLAMEHPKSEITSKGSHHIDNYTVGVQNFESLLPTYIPKKYIIEHKLSPK
jgi:hypothetical protein